MSKCLIIDGNNLLHISYHVSQKQKIVNGTVYFFLRTMIGLLRTNCYQQVLVAFDGGGNNFRKAINPHYKAHRRVPPDEIWKQLNSIYELLTKSGITCLQIIDWEADDLIASLIDRKKDVCFDIFTRDKDMLQLLDDNVRIIKGLKNNQLQLYTIDNFHHSYNFAVQSYVDYLSLVGDKVDNIRGLKGIGPVTAKKLIQDFQTIENIYLQFDNLPTNLKNMLIDKREIALGNKRIICLNNSINLLANYNCSFDWTEWKNNHIIHEFCQNNHFHSILKTLRE